jgi:hypothetical protein
MPRPPRWPDAAVLRDPLRCDAETPELRSAATAKKQLQQVDLRTVGVDVNHADSEADVHAVAFEAEDSADPVPVVDHATVDLKDLIDPCRLVTEGTARRTAGLLAS